LVWNAFNRKDARSDGMHVAAAAAVTRRMIIRVNVNWVCAL